MFCEPTFVKLGYTIVECCDQYNTWWLVSSEIKFKKKKKNLWAILALVFSHIWPCVSYSTLCLVIHWKFYHSSRTWVKSCSHLIFVTISHCNYYTPVWDSVGLTLLSSFKKKGVEGVIWSSRNLPHYSDIKSGVWTGTLIVDFTYHQIFV